MNTRSMFMATTPSTPPAVALQARQLGWQVQGTPIVQNVSLQVHSGEMLGLIGPNGSGKSSLLRLLSGVLRPQTGDVLLGDQALHRLPRRSIARQLALVAQSAHTQDAITVWDAVELGRTPWLSALQPLSARDRDIVHQALHAVGLQDKAQRTWHTLSGGERQCGAGRRRRRLPRRPARNRALGNILGKNPGKGKHPEEDPE